MDHTLRDALAAEMGKTLDDLGVLKEHEPLDGIATKMLGRGWIRIWASYFGVSDIRRMPLLRKMTCLRPVCTQVHF